MNQPPLKFLNMPPSLNWIPVEPGDVALVLLVGGKRYAVRPVSDWDKLFAAAKDIAWETKLPVKLLPLTGTELCNFLGVAPDVLSDPSETAADFHLIMTTCWEVLAEAQDPDARKQAIELMQSLKRPDQVSSPPRATS